MEISREGLAELADYEDIMQMPYLDSGGVKTVGIGSTSSDVPDLPSWPWDKKISIEEAIDIYKKGLVKYEAAVNSALNGKVIPQNQYDALVSITYNIGTGAMRNSTFMKRVMRNDSPANIVAAMKMFNKDNGKTVQGLINRRKYEGDVFLTSKYKSGGFVDVIPVNIKHQPAYHLGKRINLLTYI